MVSLVLNITLDCLDARSVAQFWEAVTGHGGELQHQPGNDYWVVGPPDGSLPRLLFVTVPEKKATKNRVHLDLLPKDAASQEEEVARLVDLGARVVDDRRDSESWRLIVMADPEGNEFCIEPEPS